MALGFTFMKSSNSLISRATSGPQVFHLIKDNSSSLFARSVAPPQDLIMRLFCSCTWSRAICEVKNVCMCSETPSSMWLNQIYKWSTTENNETYRKWNTILQVYEVSYYTIQSSLHALLWKTWDRWLRSQRPFHFHLLSCLANHSDFQNYILLMKQLQLTR